MAEIEGEIPETPETKEVESDLASQIESAVDKQERPEREEGEAERPRNRRGRFEARQDKGEAGPGSAEKAGPGEEKPGKAVEAGPGKAERGEAGEARPGAVTHGEVGKEAVKPPPGYSVATKVAWDKETLTPQEWAAAKADIAKREGEVTTGFQRFGGLNKFAEEAEKNGTNLQSAVNDYVQVETELRRDFLGGIEFLCRRMGVPFKQVIDGLNQKYGGAGQVEAGGGQTQATQQQNSQQIDPRAIAEHAASVLRSEFEQRDINKQIADFSADRKNKFFENVRADMAHLVSIGKVSTLEDAYQAACWLNPDVRSILIEEAHADKRDGSIAVAEKARRAAKAVAGAPSPGADSNGATRGRSRSLADEIRANLADQEQG